MQTCHGKAFHPTAYIIWSHLITYKYLSEGERKEVKGGGRKQAKKEEKEEEGGRKRGQAGKRTETDWQTKDLADDLQEYKQWW